MSRTITIDCPQGGKDMYSVLQDALKLLNAAGIKVDAAAQIMHANSPPTATIVLRRSSDRARAIGILQRAGVLVQK